MTKVQQFLAKMALTAIDAAGSSGIGRDALLAQVGIMAERPISSADGADLISLLLERGWVIRYTDPITEIPRYILSGQGNIAKGAL